MQIPAARIQQRQRVMLRADRLRESRTLQQLNRGMAARQLRRGDTQALRLPLTARRAQRAIATRLAIDAKPFYQVEHESRRAARHLIHAAAKIEPVAPFHFIRIQFQSGIDLTTVAPGSAPTYGMCLQQCDLSTGFGEVQSCREPRDSAAHDNHIGAAIAAWRRTHQGRFCGFVV